jgi:hypothetical protein
MSQQSTEELRGRDYVIALLWLTRARAAAASGLQTTFILRPGGVAGGNVYTNWPTLYAALSRVQGPRWVWIDGSLGVPLVPAGTYNVDQVIFGTFGNGFPAFSGGTLNFESGAVFDFTWIQLTGNLTFATASSTPVATMVEGGSILLDCDSEINGNPTAPWAVVPDGVTAAVFVRNDAELGEGTNAAISVDPTGFLNVFAWDRAIIEANCIATPGAAGVVANVYTDATTQLTLHFGPHIGQVLQDSASLVQYTATTPGNWNPVPSTVLAALDALAAPNESTTTNPGALGPALTVTLQSAAFTRALSGKFVVAATLSGIDAADSDTITAQLLLDGAPVGPVVKNATTSAGATWNAAITWIVSVADAVAHHASITATGASDVTVAIGQAGIAVHELP